MSTMTASGAPTEGRPGPTVFALALSASRVTLRQLASATGISEATTGAVVRGSLRPSQRVAGILASALGLESIQPLLAVYDNTTPLPALRITTETRGRG